MKRFFIPFTITLVVITLIFTTTVLFTQNQKLTEERDVYQLKTGDLEKKYTEIQDLLTVITPETFEGEVKSGKKMYAYIGRPDCGDCNSLDPQLVQYIKDHPEVKKNLVFVNVRLIREDAVKWEQFQKDFSVVGTPHFTLWENGKQVSKSEWTKETGYSIDVFDRWWMKVYM